MTYGLLPAVGLTLYRVLAAAVNVLVGIAAFSADLRTRRHAAPANAALLTFGAAGDPAGSHVRVPDPDRIRRIGICRHHIGDRLGPPARDGDGLLRSTCTAHRSWWSWLAMGIGSALYGRVQRTTEAHRRWFAALAFLIAFTAALSMIFLPRIPFLFVRFFPLLSRRALAGRSPRTSPRRRWWHSLPFLLFGAMFPAVIGSLGGAAVRFGRTIGAAYAANTIGIVAGACLAEFALIPTIGLRATMTLGVLAAVGGGLCGMVARTRTEAPAPSEHWHRRRRLAHRRDSARLAARSIRGWGRLFRASLRNRRDVRRHRQRDAAPLLPRRQQLHDLR